MSRFCQYLVCICYLFLGQSAGAELDLCEPDELSTETTSEVKQAAITVLAQKTFEHCREVTYWDHLKREDETRNKIPEWLKPILQTLSDMLAGILWLGMGLLIGIVVYFILRWRGSGVQQKTIPLSQPSRVLGLDIRPESLPDDIPNTVWSLWQEGEQRAALGLLYRGTLVQLLKQGIQLEASFTEGDCQQAVKTLQNTALNQFFSRLTRAWQQLAYAHEKPDDETIQQLCNTWRTSLEITQAEDI